MRRLLPILCTALLSTYLQAGAQTTVVIQPHFANGHDGGIHMMDSTNAAWGSNPKRYWADSVVNHWPEITIDAWTSLGCPDFGRWLMRFNPLSDTAVIPAGATITSARLILYGIPSSISDYGNSLFPGSPYPNLNPGWIQLLADTFSFTGTNWHNQPAVLHTDSVAIPISSSHWSQNDTMNVTSLVAYLVAHGNTGLLFRLQSETFYQERMWASSTYSDSTMHPRLEVTYTRSSGISNTTAAVEDVTIYPSPASDQLHIRLTATAPSETGIEIYNLEGVRLSQQISTLHAGNNETVIPVSSLAAGIYLVKINGTEVRRFVKE